MVMKNSITKGAMLEDQLAVVQGAVSGESSNA